MRSVAPRSALLLLAFVVAPARPLPAQETPVEAPETAPDAARDAALEELTPAQRAEYEKLLHDLASVEWREGPIDGALKEIATLKVPAGFRFTGAEGARKMLEIFGNLTDGTESGMIAPIDDQGDGDWQAVFEWNDVGKVEDDEKLDAKALFDQMKEAEPAANEERERRGFEPLELLRFTTDPHYDEATHNLEWGILIRGRSGGESVNYQVKLLGRYGFMSATLLCAPELVEKSLPKFREVLKGFEWNEGKSYAEWKQGDPIAEFGMTGLIVGGAAAAAWKFGLLAKLGKFLKVIVVAVVGGVAAVWRWITGRSRSKTPGA